MSPAWQLHHHVGDELAVVGGDRRLLGEVAVVEHAGQLNHPSELYLAPPTTDMWGLQGALQVGCGGSQRLELFVEPGFGAGPVALHLLQLRLDLTKGVLERPHEVVDRLLPMV